MKRHLSVLASLFVIAAMMLSLASCDLESLFGGEKHEHTFSAEWSYDATNHWHAANCNKEDACKEAVADKAEHTFENGMCSVCQCEDPNYVPPQSEHVHTFATGWAKDEAGHWHPATCSAGEECSAAKGEYAVHSYDATTRLCVCGAEDPTPVAGSKDAPIALTVPGELTLNYVPNAASDPVWYTFTAAENATLGITLSANAVMGYGVDKANMLYTDGETYVEVELTANTTYYVNFSTEDLAAGEITVEAEYVVAVPVGNIAGTYTFNDGRITVVITTDEGEMSGTVAFTHAAYGGGTTTDTYVYRVEDNETILYANAEATEPVSTMFYALTVVDGKVVSVICDGWEYDVDATGGSTVTAGIVGAYTPATEVPGALAYTKVEVTATEITVYFFSRGQERSTSFTYTLNENGVPVMDGEYQDYTFTVGEDGKLATMVDLLNDPDGITYTLAPAATTPVEPVPETGFEGAYTAVGNYGSWAITITSTTVTAEMSAFFGTTTLTATYTVDENGNIVIPTDAGDFEDWVFTFNADNKLTAVQDGNGDQYTVEVPGAPVEGSEEDPIEIEIVEGTTNTVYAATESYTGIYYTFTAGATGILTVTYPEANGYVDLYDIEHLLDDIYASSETVYSLEVREGYTYILKLSVSEDLEKAPAVTLNFVEQALPNKGDYEKPGDAYDTPLDEYSGIVCEFPGTEDNTKYYWYKYTSYTGGTITVTFDKAVNVKHGETTLAAVTTFTFEVAAETPYFFGIQTTDLAAAEVKFGISCAAPQGTTSDNPFIAEVGENDYSYKGGELYHSFTSENGGTYIFTIYDATAFIHDADYAIQLDASNRVPVTFTLTAGQTVMISISNFDSDYNVVPVDGVYEISASTGYEGEYTASTTDAMANPAEITVVIDSQKITILGVNPRNGMEIVLAEFTYTVAEDGTITYAEADGTPVTDAMLFSATFEEKVLTAVTYNGVAYTVASTEGGEEGGEGGDSQTPVPGSDANNAIVIESLENAYTASANGDASNFTWYTYTATVDGTITIAYPDDNSWMVYQIGGAESMDSSKASFTLNVVAGDVCNFALGVWDANADNAASVVTITFAEKEEEEVTPPATTDYTGVYTHAAASATFTVTITADTIEVKRALSYNPNNPSTLVNAAAYTITDGKIVIDGTTRYSITIGEDGTLTLNDNSATYALTKLVEDTTPTGTVVLGDGKNVDATGWT